MAEERAGPIVVHPLPRRTRRTAPWPRRWNRGRALRPGTLDWPAWTQRQNRLLRQTLAALLIGVCVWGLGKVPGEIAPRARQYILGWLERDSDFAGAWQRVRAMPVFVEVTGLEAPLGEPEGASEGASESVPRDAFTPPAGDFSLPGGQAGDQVTGPPAAGRIVAPFALTPESETAHLGVDLATAPRAQVRAVEAGRVAVVGYDPEHAGLYVVLVHANGWESLYGRLSAVLVDEGAEVRPDDPLGLAGTDAEATLHFEVRRNGALVDPTALLTAEETR